MSVRAQGSLDFILVMGVSGCGKSTVAAALAKALGGTLVEGDSLHPPGNVAAMSVGKPLNDEMRLPWLLAICNAALNQTNGPRPVVIACSALKRRYRDLLREHLPGLVPVHLDGSAEVLRRRMDERSGHFMPASLLASQIADLEPPGIDEGVIRADIETSLDGVVAQVLAALTARISPVG